MAELTVPNFRKMLPGAIIESFPLPKEKFFIPLTINFSVGCRVMINWLPLEIINILYSLLWISIYRYTETDMQNVGVLIRAYFIIRLKKSYLDETLFFCMVDFLTRASCSFSSYYFHFSRFFVPILPISLGSPSGHAPPDRWPFCFDSSINRWKLWGVRRWWMFKVPPPQKIRKKNLLKHNTVYNTVPLVTHLKPSV